ERCESPGRVLFQVVREGIGISQRLVPPARVRLQAIGMLTLEPERLMNQLTTTRKRSLEMEGLFTGNAPAACDFSFSASKFSPFFHRVSVMAAILRARGETHHRRLDAFRQRSLVEILEWSGLHTRPGGGS